MVLILVTISIMILASALNRSQTVAILNQHHIDFDVCSNWGNWAYVAGVGNDPRADRYFNVIKQAHDYDADGGYVKTWLPELESLSAELVHEPWKLDAGVDPTDDAE